MTPPAKRALLVGIDAYAHVRPLRGCVNDVAIMRGVLVDTFGFAADRIRQLTNEQATRDAMLASLDTLVADTGTGDIVVFYFAGHGSQMTDREGDEPSGFDSTLMPYDTARAPGANRDITDDEVQQRLEALAGKTPYVTVIVDACHSGTVTRDAFGGEARSVAADRRPAAELPPSPTPAGRLDRVASGPSGWMPLSDAFVLIAGCRDEERSYEFFPPEGGGTLAYGALTFFLCQQLRKATAATTYRDVFERVAALVNAEYAEQHPQMEGRADREVFGVRDLVPASFVRVDERAGSIVLLTAGAAHGVTPGSTLGVYPPGTPDPAAAPALGEVEVSFVGAVTAEARILRETAAGAIVAGARAFVSAHGFGDFRLAVHLVAEDGDASAVAAMGERLRNSPRVKLVGADAAAAARVYLLPPRREVPDGAPVPQVGASALPRWAVVGQTGDLLMEVKAIGEEETVVANLERLARYRQMLAIENPDPASRLKGRFTLDLLRQERDGAWRVAPADPATGLASYDEGDSIAFRVTSAHDAPAYVSLLDFGLTGAVTPVFPPRGAQQSLAPGTSFAIPGPGRGWPLGWPAGFPYVDTADRRREAQGIETVRLFATEQPTDFVVVEQPGMRSSGGRTPLAALLRHAMHGGAVRGVVMAPEAGDDWTTVSRSFVLRRRKEA